MRKYKVTHNPLGSILIIEIDHNEKTEALIKKQVESKWHWEQILASNNGGYTATFLKDIASILFLERAKVSGGRLESFIEHLADVDELWCSFDGSQGIELTFIDDPNIDKHEYYSISEC